MHLRAASLIPSGRYLRTLVLPLALGILCPALPAAAPAKLPAPARELVLTTTALADKNWDSRAGMLWNGPTKTSHGVRTTTWYLIALLLRDAPGDRDRASQVLQAILNHQIHAPGAAWHGTFYRTAEEATPRHDAKIWHDYDPNWRQFIGTALVLVLAEFEDRLSPDDRRRIDQSLALAVEGELAHGRLRTSYTNISLMHGFLQSYVGKRQGRPDWVREGETWIETVYAEFQPHGSFPEFNSPTYYGVDLYGLALLRRHGATPRLVELGRMMERELWRDISQFYHAGLRNLAGPFDRTYGMDLSRYASLLGVWLRLSLPEAEAPLPVPGLETSHGHDLFFAPCFALLGVEIPDDARPAFRHFSGERQITRPIADGRRVATAWLAPELMIGGEATGLSQNTQGLGGQFRPATIHWRAPDASVGWIALIQSPRVDAVAAPHRLSIHAIGDSVLRVSVPGIARAQIDRECWKLPGLEVRVESDARSFSFQTGADHIDITYHAATQLTLHPHLASPFP